MTNESAKNKLATDDPTPCTCVTSVSAFSLVLVLIASTVTMAQEASPQRQVPWTVSKVKGSPDPPLPYKATRVFQNVSLAFATDAFWLPSAKKWIVTQENGQVVAFENDQEDATAKAILNLKEIESDLLSDPVRRTYATMFHPDQENQPWCFVTFTSTPKDPNGHHLGRFKVLDATIPTIDSSSLEILFSWNSAGHVGGSMQFGSDGMLYLSVGDGQNPYPPDAHETGQDLSDLESSILRINVDDPTAENPYRIPPDNPFVGQPNVREEIWAFGLRNPWKIAFHPDNGDLLAADVGWEMREMIHRIDRGRNHGWSLMEGSQPVKQGFQPAIPITPPLFEHTHLDSRSISGGNFWQSDRLPELKGAYIYGDWMTGKIWALKSEGDQVNWQKELVDTPYRMIGGMLGPSGEVFILNYDGEILRLDPNDDVESVDPFPSRLSDTGLFADVAKQLPVEGVVEYEISAHHWADGTFSKQWIGIPDSQQLGLFAKDDWTTGQAKGRFIYPPDTVLVKTVSYLTREGDPTSKRYLETQLLHRYVDDWRAYNYVWNEEQTDALLQEDVATERKLVIEDLRSPGGTRSQTWRHASRSECLLCHIWAGGSTHAFWLPQLNIEFSGENQIERMTRLGLFEEPFEAPMPLVSPHDTSASLESRARSYLALNCATCHRKQGGGTANFDFDITNSLEANNYIDAIPAQGAFGIDNAKVVAPGDPLRSVLLYRTLKSGRGHMPQFGSNVIDMTGVEMLHDWIESIADKRERIQSIDAQSLVGANDVIQEIASLLSTTCGAMGLSMACNDAAMDDELRALIVKQGTAHKVAEIRDLFEHYIPEDQRVKRLGPTIDTEALLVISGSSERGKHLFEQAKEINCRACHRIGEVGQNVGPDLSGIGTQQTPAEILTSIVNPSEKIGAKYRARQILTADGKAFVGIVLKETEEELSLVDSAGKTHTIAADEIEVMQPASKSAMPDQLLAGMTPQQAADLIAFLSAQRKIGPRQQKHVKVVRTASAIVIDGKRDEEDWARAESVGDFEFTWWKEGDGERQPTNAKILWDDKFLYVSFICTDSNVLATRTEHDSDVYRDDCVEVFASPEIDHPEHYFNIEMNALSTCLDEYRRTGEKPADSWTAKGIQVAVSVDGTINDSTDVDRSWSLEVAIPFQLFAHVLPDGHPKPGDQWRLNLNRLEDNMSIKSQWSQGDRTFPRFHHPEYFGFVEFAP